MIPNMHQTHKTEYIGYQYSKLHVFLHLMNGNETFRNYNHKQSLPLFPGPKIDLSKRRAPNSLFTRKRQMPDP